MRLAITTAVIDWHGIRTEKSIRILDRFTLKNRSFCGYPQKVTVIHQGMFLTDLSVFFTFKNAHSIKTLILKFYNVKQ